MKKLLTTLGIASIALASQASLVNISTGADTVGGVDQNWKIVSTDNPSVTTPANAYLADATQWPINGGPWLADTATSHWLTFSPTLNTEDAAGRTYDYQRMFTTSGGPLSLKWAGDNSATLSIDGNLVGTASGFSSWTTALVNLGAGQHTIDLSVYNYPQATGNPTGVRFEAFAPVPEPGTWAAGLALTLPFCFSVARKVRGKK